MAPQKRGPASSRRAQNTQPTITQPGIQRFFNNNSCNKNASVSSDPPLHTAEPAASQSLTPPPIQEAWMKPPPPAGDETHQEKRMRISPGMIIMQSQDDGAGDQVEWKLSPTAERLQEAHHVSALSNNALVRPNRNQILRSSDGLSGVPLAANPTKRRSPSLTGKLEKWLSTSEATPVLKQSVQKDPTIKSCELSEKQTPALRDKENDAAAINLSGLENDNSSLKPAQNLGRLVLSSSSRRTLVIKSQKKKSSKQRGSGKRRKALLELLDQVQNVISDPESISGQLHTEIDIDDPKKEEANRRECQIKEAEPDLYARTLDTPAEVSCSSPYQQMTIAKKSHPRIDSQEEASNVDLVIINNDVNGDLEQIETDEMVDRDNMSAIPEALARIHFLVLEVADMADPSCSNRSHMKVLRLLNEYSGVERVLYLADEWFFSVVRPGDTINVIGDFVDGKCRIDQHNNLLVVHPDILISGSKVGSSFSCPRRAVLDERIRSSSVSFPALLGTMMHELFQAGLTSKGATRLVLEQEAELIVCQHISSIYACGGDEKDALSKLKDCIPTITNWLNCFLHASTTAMPKVDFGRKDGQLPMSVSEVVDIEEMIYSPKFGLKGMIDASLLVKFGNMGLDEERILPLEFKSGKQTTGHAALEHRAQVILYTLLMSDRYLESVNNGLLFYLQTNQTQGVAIQHADLAGLVMRRNELATNILIASSTQHLPPMLQNMHACQRCWHLDTCSIYHKTQEGGTAESSGIGELFNEKTDHLKNSHFEFLKLWDRLIDLEAQELQASQREIWRLPAHEREATGRCLSSMRVKMQPDGTCEELDHNRNFVYCFSMDISCLSSNKKEGRQLKALHEKSFSCGDHVLLSTEKGHIAVASGSVCHITEDCVSIRLSRQLRLPKEQGVSGKDLLLQQVWRIDKDETASFLASMRYNVLQLFLKSNGHEQGRRLVVDLEKPRFDGGGLFSQDPAALYVRSTPDLNDDQRRAIFKILSARDYALILGMPGTGKTSTIVHAVKALLARGASILLTSYTNSAVDNILLKLKQQDVDFVRLGRESAIHQDLKEHVIEGLNISSVELDQRMTEVNVVAVTCLGVTNPLLTNRKFDVCIVDEAGQITLPVCLGPLRFANSFVLVGDHYQLPPLVRNAEARERGLSVSLFRRLSEAHPQAIAALQSQYRMNAGIMRLCNTLIYGNRLRCGSSNVANAKLVINDAITYYGPGWLQQSIDATKPVIFINTDMLITNETHHKNMPHSKLEASIVIMIIKRMVEGGVQAKDIGVISPYNYQVQHIRHLLIPDGLDMLEVHTIDRYQGRDKDCILVSFVKSTCKGSSHSTLLADWHRINVAITRAKKKLILIGSQRTLSTTPVLRFLIKEVELAGGLVNLPRDLKFLTGSFTACNASNAEKHQG